MKSNGGVLSADEVVHQPITTVLSGPAAGALGAALIAQVAGFDRVLTSDGGGTSTDVSVVIDGEPTLTTEGSVGAYPVQDPDDRRRHRRRRRRLDRLALAGGHAQGRPAVGRRRPRPDLLRPGRPRGHHHRRARRARPHPAAPAGRRDPARRRRGAGGGRGAGRRARHVARGLRHRRARDLRLEPGQRAAPGHRQARPRRPRLHPDHVRRLRLAAAVPADGHPRASRPSWCRPTPATCRRSGCSPSTSRTTTCRPTSPCTRRSTSRPCRRRTTPSRRRRARPWSKEGFAAGAAPVRPDRRRPLLRAGVRGAGRRARRRRSTRPRSPRSPGRFHAEHRALYGYDFSGDDSPAGRVGQPAGLRHRPDHAAGDQAPPAGRGSSPALDPLDRASRTSRPGLLRRGGRVRRHAGAVAPRPAAGARRPGAGGHRGVRLHGPGPPRLRRPGRRLPQHHRDAGRTLA